MIVYLCHNGFGIEYVIPKARILSLLALKTSCLLPKVVSMNLMY